jgi:hypothetical protein
MLWTPNTCDSSMGVRMWTYCAVILVAHCLHKASNKSVWISLMFCGKRHNVYVSSVNMTVSVGCLCCFWLLVKLLINFPWVELTRRFLYILCRSHSLELRIGLLNYKNKQTQILPLHWQEIKQILKAYEQFHLRQVFSCRLRFRLL